MRLAGGFSAPLQARVAGSEIGTDFWVAKRGPVYLAANGGVRPLPDVVAVLDGEIRVVLESWIDTVRRGRTGRLRSTFNAVPDAPVSRFVLTMRGGKNRGLLVNSTDLCRTRERAVANFFGHNGKWSSTRPRIGLRFKGCKKVWRHAARRTVKRKRARKAAARSVAPLRAQSPARLLREGATARPSRAALHKASLCRYPLTGA